MASMCRIYSLLCNGCFLILWRVLFIYAEFILWYLMGECSKIQVHARVFYSEHKYVCAMNSLLKLRTQICIVSTNVGRGLCQQVKKLNPWTLSYIY